MRRVRTAALAGCVALASQAVGHPVEILVGHTAAGRLAVHIVGEVPVELNPSVFPGFPGWAEAFPGFESVTLNDPAGDFYVLPETANIEFTFVSADPGGHLWNYTGTAPLIPGQTFPLGNPFFDIHPVWSIDFTRHRALFGPRREKAVVDDITGEATFQII